MMLDDFGCMNNVDFEYKKINENIVLDVFIICQKLRYIQVILKIPYSCVLIDLQSNRPKRPQLVANVLEGIE